MWRTAISLIDNNSPIPGRTSSFHHICPHLDAQVFVYQEFIMTSPGSSQSMEEKDPSLESSQSMEEKHPSPESGKTMEDKHPSQYPVFVTVAPVVSQASGVIELQTDPTCLDTPDGTRSGSMDLSAAVPEFRDLTVSAGAATRAEQKMTFLGGCQLYPKAIAWSIVLSSAIIMEGYGTTLIFSFFTLPLFQRLYGQPVHGSYQISSPWQAGLANGAVVGEVIGLFINGILSDRFGYRRTMIGALVFLSLSIFLAFFAVNISMLLAAQILCGRPPSRNTHRRLDLTQDRYTMGSLSDFNNNIRRRSHAGCNACISSE